MLERQTSRSSLIAEVSTRYPIHSPIDLTSLLSSLPLFLSLPLSSSLSLSVFLSLFISPQLSLSSSPLLSPPPLSLSSFSFPLSLPSKLTRHSPRWPYSLELRRHSSRNAGAGSILVRRSICQQRQGRRCGESLADVGCFAHSTTESVSTRPPSPRQSMLWWQQQHDQQLNIVRFFFFIRSCDLMHTTDLLNFFHLFRLGFGNLKCGCVLGSNNAGKLAGGGLYYSWSWEASVGLRTAWRSCSSLREDWLWSGHWLGTARGGWVASWGR